MHLSAESVSQLHALTQVSRASYLNSSQRHLTSPYVFILGM